MTVRWGLDICFRGINSSEIPDLHFRGLLVSTPYRNVDLISATDFTQSQKLEPSISSRR